MHLVSGRSQPRPCQLPYARVMAAADRLVATGFNKEFPFYLVQIAPFQYHSKDNGPALLREQQAMLPEMLDKVKMITVSDLVDNVQDIHPRDKRSVGKTSRQSCTGRYIPYICRPL